MTGVDATVMATDFVERMHTHTHIHIHTQTTEIHTDKKYSILLKINLKCFKKA